MEEDIYEYDQPEIDKPEIILPPPPEVKDGINRSFSSPLAFLLFGIIVSISTLGIVAIVYFAAIHPQIKFNQDSMNENQTAHLLNEIARSQRLVHSLSTLNNELMKNFSDFNNAAVDRLQEDFLRTAVDLRQIKSNVTSIQADITGLKISRLLNGWTVIQHRKVANSPSFDTNGWKQYKEGFGALLGTSYWMGLEKIHQATSQGRWQLLQWFLHKEKGSVYFVVDDFKVGSEEEKYELSMGNVAEKHMGAVSTDDNEIRYANSKPFSTRDRDSSVHQKCPEVDGGGWWFGNCAYYCSNCKKEICSHEKGVIETQVAMREIK